VSPTDRIKVTTVLAVDPATAFEIFTEEVDAWWKHGPRYRFSVHRKGVMRFEPGVGGRLVEEYDGAVGDLFEVGRVLEWKPAECLAFEWRGRNFEPGQVTRVEIRFEAVEAGTRVTLEHRGWDALPSDHPARHGLGGEAFTSMIGLWWAEILGSARAFAANVEERNRR
jgi:uncharacterized protein YndB with AHSA1/START domain